jgi:hypothetical protein
VLHSVWDRSGEKQSGLGQLRHQKEHEICNAVEKKDRPELERASLFRRSVLRMKMRSEVRRTMPGDQTFAAI